MTISMRMNKKLLPWRAALWMAPLALATQISICPAPGFAEGPAPGAVEATAHAGPAEPAAAAVAASSLPLRKLTMFSSGVGYFEHRGEIDGSARVELKFHAADINDLLKSMVIEDKGGHVSAVGYGSQDPVAKTLGTFAVDLNGNPTLAAILNQLRGQRIQVDAPDTVEGVILGVEKRTQPSKEGAPRVEVEMLNLLTDQGLRSISLEGVGRLKPTNPKVDADLRAALAVLAGAHSKDKKSVSLNFNGKGSRPVRVGYIQETPIWKTSYRLVAGAGDKALLQGWAIVENTTEDDWKDVQLTLVSGRPISFVMDLYQPLYLSRPLVQPDLFTSIVPPISQQNLLQNSFARPVTMAAQLNAPQSGPVQRGDRSYQNTAQALTRFNESRTRNGSEQGGQTGDGAALADGAKSAGGTANWDLGALGATTAQAAEVGELFQYTIDTPVTLARQQSAMLPIVNEDIQVAKVSVFNPAVQRKHPLNSLRVTNTTKLHLMQGPITVYDGGVYAGDARIGALAAGAERLVSYAVDLDVEVAEAPVAVDGQLQGMKIGKGNIVIRRENHRAHKYTIKNSSDRAKTVVVERPIQAGWKLVDPKQASEKTADLYRFTVKVEPNKTAELVVAEVEPVREVVALSGLDKNSLGYYLAQREIGPRIKDAVRALIDRKTRLDALVASQAEAHERITKINEDQKRIRNNMHALDRNSDLYKRYVRSLNDQESLIESLRGKADELASQIQSARDEYNRFMADLMVE